MAARALRFIWLVLMPVVLSVLAFRYLIPSAVHAPEGPLRELSEWSELHTTIVLLGLFVLFAGLLHYWREQLPGARHWLKAEPPRASLAGKAATLSLSTSLIVGAAVAALVLRGSLFQSYRVLSGSMLPTLEPADIVLSSQSAYAWRWPWAAPHSPALPRRGDIVVFHHEPAGPEVPEELVKRVIGLPGDTIETRGATVLINGWQVPTCKVAPYVFISGDGMLEANLRLEFLEDRAYLTAYAPAEMVEHEPYVVKPGEVFVLGDNRNNSSDSRAWNNGRGGGLDVKEIRGRVDRLLLETRRDGSWDFSRFLKPLGHEIHTENIDDSDIRSGIEYCLAHRPKETRPPAPGKATKGAP